MSPHYLVKHRCTNFLCNGDGNRGVSKLGCTEIHFIEPGVKVNGACYCDNLLAQKLLLDMRWIFQGEFFVFRQNSALRNEHATLSLSWSERHPTSSLQHCGRRIHRILTQSTIAYGM